MDKLTQFTYSYTKYKCSNGAFLGDGVYQMTSDSSADRYASRIVSMARQDFPEGSMDLTSFGYMIYGDTPTIFYACDRQDNEVIIDREGKGPYYMIHVTMGDELIKNSYAIEFFGGNVPNMTENEIDDSERPEYYAPLCVAELEEGKNPSLALENVREKQKKHLPQLALLADALMQAMGTNKRIFLCANKEKREVIGEWMAQLLMLFPKCIANKIKFNTYMPNPTENKAGFILCGVINGYSEDYNSLTNYGYVFDVGERVLTQYQPNEENAFYKVLSLCNPQEFCDWIKFFEDYCGEEEISMQQFQFLASVFRVKVDADWDVRDKIAFLNANYNNSYNKNSILQKQFLQLRENASVQNQLLEDPELAYLVVCSLKEIINDQSTSAVEADKIMELIFFYMLQCDETAHYVFDRVVDNHNSLERFFGESVKEAEKFLLKSATEVKTTLERNFFLSDGERIGTKVLICLIKIFMSSAFAHNGVEREVMSLCSMRLIRDSGLGRLVDILRSTSSANYISMAKFLLELTNENGTRYLLEEDSTYREGLFKILTSDSNRYDDIVRRYIGSGHPDETICRFLLQYKWNKKNLTLKDLISIFARVEEYRAIQGVFEECYIYIFEKNIDSICQREIEGLVMLTTEQLNEKMAYIRNAQSMFEEYYSRNPRIGGYAIRLDRLVDYIGYQTANAKRAETSRDTRIAFVCRKLYQIPPKPLRKLMREYGIEIQGRETGDDFMKNVCTKVERFLKGETNSLEDRRKIDFCNQVDRIAEKYRMVHARNKIIAEASFDLVSGSIIIGLFAVLFSILCGILFAKLANGYFSLIYKIIPVFAAIFSGVMFYTNENILHKNKRITISILEALCLTGMLVIIYHCFALLI